MKKSDVERGRVSGTMSWLQDLTLSIFNIIGSQEKAIQYFHLVYLLVIFSDTCRFYLDQIGKNWIKKHPKKQRNNTKKWKNKHKIVIKSEKNMQQTHKK